MTYSEEQIEYYKGLIARLVAKGVDPRQSTGDVAEYIKKIEALGGRFELLIPDEPKLEVVQQESKSNGRKAKKTLPQVIENGVDVATDAVVNNPDESI